MKKMKVFFCVAAFVLLALPCHAAKEGKGASEKAYEHASDKAVFNRVTDWFSTIGKSKEEKEKIIAERDAARQQKRLQKQAKKQQKKGAEEIEDGQNKLQKQERKEMKNVTKQEKKLNKALGKGKNK